MPMEAPPERIQQAAKRIQIMHTDGTNQNFVVARKYLSDAEVICFLGFGFHPTNVQRLLDGVKPRTGVFTLFTTFGLKRPEITAMVHMLQPVLASLGEPDPGFDVLHFLRDKFVWWLEMAARIAAALT